MREDLPKLQIDSCHLVSSFPNLLLSPLHFFVHRYYVVDRKADKRKCNTAKYVQDILPKGIVHYDTDATECVRNGVFREVKLVSKIECSK